MATRFMPITICEVPPALAKHGDDIVLAELNLLLTQHGYRAQPLEPAQFVEPRAEEDFCGGCGYDQELCTCRPQQRPRHNHHALGKSPRQRERAKKRVARLQKGSRR